MISVRRGSHKRRRCVSGVRYTRPFHWAESERYTVLPCNIFRMVDFVLQILNTFHVIFQIECKDNGFNNKSVSGNHQLCLQMAMIWRIRSILMPNSSANL